MKIRSVRKAEELQEVCFSPIEKESLEEVIYWVFSDVTNSDTDKWENMTVTSPVRIGKEFPKTYGHYHSATKINEIYTLVSGKGIFLLQKKHYEGGVFVPEIVDEVILIMADKPGQTITVPYEYGHSWSNIGIGPLITFDTWRSGHHPIDYAPIKQLKGLAYYLTEENGEAKFVPNPNYKELPKPKWTTPEEFAKLKL